MITTTLPFNYNGVPVLKAKDTIWSVTTAFSGASVGDIIFKIDLESFFNTSTGGTNIDTYYTYYFNVNTATQLLSSAVNLANLTYLSGGGTDTAVLSAVNNVSSSLNTTNSSLAVANTLNSNGNTTLSGISASLSTLNTFYSNCTLNTDSIPINTTRTYSNVKSALVVAQPVLLGTTLNTSSITINGATYSLNSPITVPIPSNTKLSNNLVVSGGNIPTSVIYTT